MTDDFQQMKGLLGQEIAKLYLERIKKWKILDKEVPVEGLDSVARLDFVVKTGGGKVMYFEPHFEERTCDNYTELTGGIALA